ncbi:MAG TPA: efflux RND transporter periplasmic adaptor subunit [Desulfomonilia bacterium]
MNRRKAAVIVAAILVIMIVATLAIYYFSKHSQTPSMSQTQSANAFQTDEAPSLDMSEAGQKMIGVKTVPVSFVEMNSDLRLAGRIEYDEQRISTVNAKVDGWIERLYVDFEGRPVEKGESLLDIYSPELLSAQKELLSLKAFSGRKDSTDLGRMVEKDAEELISAARKRLILWDITEGQIAQIERTGKPVRALTIRSPVTGTVFKRYAVKGMQIMPGEPLFDIADLSRVWVVAEVPEADMQQVKQDMAVKISFEGMPGKTFNSRIDYVYPVMSGSTRTVRIRCVLDNPGGSLKPQMYATLTSSANLGRRLAVPADAVIDTGLRQIVYVDKGDETFEPREVRTGISAGGMREILSGVNVGEKVAATGTFLIDSEAQLKGVTLHDRK